MIIDCGYDLLQLAKERLFNDTLTSPLVVIAMTGDLDFYFMKTVDKHYNGCLDDYHEAILRSVDKDFVRYFAVAHECTASPRPETMDHESTERLKAAASAIGLHLVSELYVGRREWASTGPMSFFKHYMDDNLPRISARRPPRFAGTRMKGGVERPSADTSLYERFSWEMTEVG